MWYGLKELLRTAGAIYFKSSGITFYLTTVDSKILDHVYVCGRCILLQKYSLDYELYSFSDLVSSSSVPHATYLRKNCLNILQWLYYIQFDWIRLLGALSEQFYGMFFLIPLSLAPLIQFVYTFFARSNLYGSFRKNKWLPLTILLVYTCKNCVTGFSAVIVGPLYI